MSFSISHPVSTLDLYNPPDPRGDIDPYHHHGPLDDMGASGWCRMWYEKNHM